MGVGFFSVIPTKSIYNARNKPITRSIYFLWERNNYNPPKEWEIERKSHFS